MLVPFRPPQEKLSVDRWRAERRGYFNVRRARQKVKVSCTRRAIATRQRNNYLAAGARTKTSCWLRETECQYERSAKPPFLKLCSSVFLYGQEKPKNRRY